MITDILQSIYQVSKVIYGQVKLAKTIQVQCQAFLMKQLTSMRAQMLAIQKPIDKPAIEASSYNEYLAIIKGV